MAAPTLDLTNVRRVKSYAVNVSEATAAPDLETTRRLVLSPVYDTIRAFIRYGPGVTDACIRLWILKEGVWYRGPSTDDGDPLVPPTSEIRNWPGSGADVAALVVERLVGGTISLDVQARRTR